MGELKNKKILKKYPENPPFFFRKKKKTRENFKKANGGRKLFSDFPGISKTKTSYFNKMPRPTPNSCSGIFDACRVSGASTSSDCKKYKEACSKYVNFKRVFPSEFAAAQKGDYLMKQ